MDWFRWHHGTVTDRKWPRLASRAGTTVANVIAIWAVILESASQAEPRGYARLSNDDAGDLDAALGVPAGTAQSVFGALCERGMIDADGRLSAWDKRQPKRERDDSSADRVREHRQRKAEAANSTGIEKQVVTSGVTDVTPCNANGTHVTPRGEEIREKRREEKREQRSPNGSRLPSDWKPSEEEIAWARQERKDLDIQKQADRFRDYWTAKAGKDATKRDWAATWRNWIRSARADSHAVQQPQPARDRELL